MTWKQFPQASRKVKENFRKKKLMKNCLSEWLSHINGKVKLNEKLKCDENNFYHREKWRKMKENSMSNDVECPEVCRFIFAPCEPFRVCASIVHACISLLYCHISTIRHGPILFKSRYLCFTLLNGFDDSSNENFFLIELASWCRFACCCTSVTKMGDYFGVHGGHAYITYNNAIRGRGGMKLGENFLLT